VHAAACTKCDHPLMLACVRAGISPITRARATIAKSVRGQPHATGWRRVQKTCCRRNTSTSSSHSPQKSPCIAYWNKKAVYGLLFKVSGQTISTIAAAPKRLGAKVGMTSVLHTWALLSPTILMYT
jgi:hypothetical protein